MKDRYYRHLQECRSLEDLRRQLLPEEMSLDNLFERLEGLYWKGLCCTKGLRRLLRHLSIGGVKVRVVSKASR